MAVCLLAVCLALGGCGNVFGSLGRADIPPLVERWRADVERYAAQYGIPEYNELLLAIIAQESGGDAERVPDIMQSSASAGLPGNSITDPVESIRQGVFYFSTLVGSGERNGVDLDTVIQSYNFGGGYQDYVAENGGGIHSETLARDFSESMCRKHGYPVYGDVLYVEHVRSFLSPGGEDGISLLQDCMDEYEGVPYLYGGNGKYGIDCSALTQKLMKSIGITLPRTAQSQYNAVPHVTDREARAGDLVFFHGTSNKGTYITHVGLYVGKGRMFHASAGEGRCCYTSIETEYYKQHLAGFGRP